MSYKNFKLKIDLAVSTIKSEATIDAEFIRFLDNFKSKGYYDDGAHQQSAYLVFERTLFNRNALYISLTNCFTPVLELEL